jgi:D-aminopeptidase
MKLKRREFLKLFPAALLLPEFSAVIPFRKRKRPRELGIKIGRLQPGDWNAITDVPGVKVGHSTIIRGSGKLEVGKGPVRTGVTVILPHDRIAEEYLPAGYHILNGNGEVTGLTQIESMGVIGAPICLTNTSSIGMVYDAVASRLPKDGLMPVVGETWDAWLNDVEGRHVHAEHVFAAMDSAASGPVAEGNVGGGTGMTCYQFKGGIGTASRKLRKPLDKYTVGVLVQANHGSREELRIDGVPVGEELTDLMPEPDEASYLSSILIVIATDLPLLDYQLNRVARRGAMGLAHTGSVAHNSSGDFIMAFSTANRIPAKEFWNGKTYSLRSIEQYDIEPLFSAVAEATDEAIINVLFAAEDMIGRDDHKVYALPADRVLKIMERHKRLFREEKKKIAFLTGGRASLPAND